MQHAYTWKQRDEFLRESNAIEGVYGDEHLEKAVAAWNFIEQEDVMTEANVKETHRILMDDPRMWSNPSLMEKNLATFRDAPVYVGINAMLSPKLIPEKLDMWCFAMNKEMNDEDPEKVSRDMHVFYETIHPFMDGNGRTGRIFMNWWRLRNGLPLLVIRDADKQQYYRWFTK